MRTGRRKEREGRRARDGGRMEGKRIKGKERMEERDRREREGMEGREREREGKAQQKRKIMGHLSET